MSFLFSIICFLSGSAPIPVAGPTIPFADMVLLFSEEDIPPDVAVLEASVTIEGESSGMLVNVDTGEGIIVNFYNCELTYINREIWVIIASGRSEDIYATTRRHMNQTAETFQGNWDMTIDSLLDSQHLCLVSIPTFI